MHMHTNTHLQAFAQLEVELAIPQIGQIGRLQNGTCHARQYY